MRQRWVVGVVWVLLGLAAGVAGARAQDAPAQERVRIAGSVVDEDGGPLAATVALYGVPTAYEARRTRLLGLETEPAVSARTSADGVFRIAAPAPGMWRLEVRAPGRAPARVELYGLVEDRELLPIELRPLESVRVVVLDDTSSPPSPIAGALVAAIPGRGSGSRLNASRTYTRPHRVLALADANGVAELPLSRRAGAEIRVNAVGFEPAEAEGSDAEVRVRLARSATRTLRIVDDAGKPVAEALVSAGSPYLPYALSAEDGTVAVPMPPEGFHHVLIEAADGARVTTEVAPDEGMLEVRLSRPVAVAGKVLSAETRTGVEGAWVWPGGDPGRAVRTGAGGDYSLGVVASGGASSTASEILFGKARGFFQGSAEVLEKDLPAGRGPSLVLEAGARIAGVVLDANEAPVADAIVRFRPSGRGAFRILGRERGAGSSARTDREGRFELGPVPVETGGRVVARRSGFAPAAVEVPGLAAGARRVVELRLLAGRRVLGAVVDELERPVAGAEVTLTLLPEGGGDINDLINRRFGGDEPLRAFTDAEGAFELRDLEHGRYDLRVEAPTYAPAVVPAVEVPADGGVVELGTVTLSPGVEVEGRVVDAEGAPIAGAEVALEERGGGVMVFSVAGEEREPDAITDEDGRFRIGSLAENSRVDLQVSKPGYADAGLQGVRAPTLEPVEIRMQAASTLRGVVVDDRGKGVANATVRLMRAQGQSSGSVQMIANIMENTSTDGEGRFEVENIAAGRWDVSASARGFQPAEKSGIEITPGTDPDEVRLALERGAALEGTVYGADGKPLPQAVVRKVETDRDPFSFRGVGSVARTDGDGRYRLDGLPPGTVSVRVDHDKHQALVRDVTVRPGDNAMDFHLSAGWQISGRIVDETGLPVAGASVTAREPSAGLRISIGRNEGVQTGEDGTYVIEGLADGSYFVNASKSGFAAARTEEAVKVDGQSVYGIDLRLERGAAITGRIVGLEFDELSKLQIFAFQPGGAPQPAIGQVDYEGSYRIDNLAAGDWMVMASVGDGGRSLRETVTIEPGAVETVLDLEFGGGLTLSGQVLRDGEPVAGLNLFASGKTRGSGGQATTDQNGRFAIEGLEADTYTVVMMTLGAATGDQREIELTSDRDVVITLRESTVSGRVVDSLDGSPVAGAELRLQPLGEEEQRFSFAFGSPPRSEPDGTFRLGGVAPGRYSLQATKEGYGAGTVELEVAEATDPAPVEIRLEASAGVVLYVLSATGQGVEQATVAVLDASGQLRSLSFLGAGEGGRVELTDLPPGEWALLVSAGGTGTREVRVSSPGDPVTVRLPETGALRVRVPELQDAGARAEVTLLDQAGKPYRSLQFRTVQEEWTMLDGVALLSGVPVGTWTVRVETADGSSSWTTTTRVVAGAVLEVTVE